MTPSTSTRSTSQEVVLGGGFRGPLETGLFEDFRCQLGIVKFLVLHNSHFVQSSVFSIGCINHFLLICGGAAQIQVNLFRFQVGLSVQEFLIKKSCVYFHSTSV